MMMRKKQIIIAGIAMIYIGFMFIGVQKLYYEGGKPDISVSDIFIKPKREVTKELEDEEPLEIEPVVYHEDSLTITGLTSRATFDCIPYYGKQYDSIEELVREASVVAKIHVDDQQFNDDNNMLYSQVTVDKLYKGDTSESFEIETYVYDRVTSVDRSYIVFLSDQSDRENTYTVLGLRNGIIGVSDEGDIYGTDEELLEGLEDIQHVEEVINEALADTL